MQAISEEPRDLLPHEQITDVDLVNIYNIPILYIFLLCWLPVTYHSGLPIWVGLSFLLNLFFSLFSPSYPSPSLVPVLVGKKPLLCEPGEDLSSSGMHSSSIHWVYPNDTL